MIPRKIILHCTATEPDHDINVEWLRRLHVNRREWSDVGYHFFIDLTGKWHIGRPVWRPGAHTKGENKTSIGIAYAGGVKDGKPTDTMFECQDQAFRDLVDVLRRVYGDLPIHGHREFANKACPSFDVVEKFGAEYCGRD